MDQRRCRRTASVRTAEVWTTVTPLPGKGDARRSVASRSTHSHTASIQRVHPKRSLSSHCLVPLVGSGIPVITRRNSLPSSTRRGVRVQTITMTLQYVGLPTQSVPTRLLRPTVPVFTFELQSDHLTVVVFEGMLVDDAVFSFDVQRAVGTPLGFNVYKDGLFFERLSACCEFRYHEGQRLGGASGSFKVRGIAGGQACLDCRVKRVVRDENLRGFYGETRQEIPESTHRVGLSAADDDEELADADNGLFNRLVRRLQAHDHHLMRGAGTGPTPELRLSLDDGSPLPNASPREPKNTSSAAHAKSRRYFPPPSDPNAWPRAEPFRITGVTSPLATSNAALLTAVANLIKGQPQSANGSCEDGDRQIDEPKDESTGPLPWINSSLACGQPAFKLMGDGSLKVAPDDEQGRDEASDQPQSWSSVAQARTENPVAKAVALRPPSSPRQEFTRGHDIRGTGTTDGPAKDLSAGGSSPLRLEGTKQAVTTFHDDVATPSLARGCSEQRLQSTPRPGILRRRASTISATRSSRKVQFVSLPSEDQLLSQTRHDPLVKISQPSASSALWSPPPLTPRHSLPSPPRLFNFGSPDLFKADSQRVASSRDYPELLLNGDGDDASDDSNVDTGSHGGHETDSSLDMDKFLESSDDGDDA